MPGEQLISQPARWYFKLRNNVALDGDLVLARMEAEALLGVRVRPISEVSSLWLEFPQLSSWQGLMAPMSHARMAEPLGYAAETPCDRLVQLVRRLTFVQALYGVTADTHDVHRVLEAARKDLGGVLSWRKTDGLVLVHAIPHHTLHELADTVVRRSSNPSTTRANLGLMLSALSGQTEAWAAVRWAEIALGGRSTVSHLSHDVHYYKAKFFPRLARCLLNVCAAGAGDGPHRVVDPFVGSGTTLLEAAVLGMPSVGVDIDPLSVLIGRAKLDAVQQNSRWLADEVVRAAELLNRPPVAERRELGEGAGRAAPPLELPGWLLKNRKMTPEASRELSQQILAAQAAIAGCHPRVRPLFDTLLSDAIARKVRMRFLGTGVGRFSLTFARASVAQMLTASLGRYAKVAAAAEWLRDAAGLRLAEAEVVAGDARRLPPGLGDFDILVTSPPYLPAASGRESYTRARAVSLVALGMQKAADLDALADNSIGSMGESRADWSALTAAEHRLVAWLHQDSLRRIKASPTAQYFLDMRRALTEMRRVLAPGAYCAVVSGRQSTFYRSATRQVLQVAQSAEYLAEEAARAGFQIDAMHHLQLVKRNPNARPRSLDDYYETIILMRNPSADGTPVTR